MKLAFNLLQFDLCLYLCVCVSVCFVCLWTASLWSQFSSDIQCFNVQIWRCAIVSVWLGYLLIVCYSAKKKKCYNLCLFIVCFLNVIRDNLDWLCSFRRVFKAALTRRMVLWMWLYYEILHAFSDCILRVFNELDKSLGFS